jgi:primosomal protein N' (replication factor Y)
VFIQTSQPENPLFGFIRNRDFASLAAIQLHERKLFRYPPYFRLIKVVVKHKNHETADRASVLLAAELRKQNQLNVLGPVAPMISRIQNWYHREIWLKFDRNQNQAQVKDLLIRLIGDIKQLPMNSGCSFNIDVDPQ